jgi:hypothetical protein
MKAVYEYYYEMLLSTYKAAVPHNPRIHQTEHL